MRNSFVRLITMSVIAFTVCSSATADTIVNRREGWEVWEDSFRAQWHPTEEFESLGIVFRGFRSYDQFTLPQSANISGLEFQMAIGYSNFDGPNPQNPIDGFQVDSWEVSLWRDRDGEPSDRVYVATLAPDAVTSELQGIHCHDCDSGLFADWAVYSFTTALPTTFHAERDVVYWLSVVAKTPTAQPGFNWISSGSASDRWWLDRLGQDGSAVERFDPLDFASNYRDRAFRLQGIPDLRGDFDGDGLLDTKDIDGLTRMLGRTGRALAFHDLNSDEGIDQSDRRIWVTELKRTWFGDANLDGRFDSGDMVQVFQAGQYEDAISRNSTWSTGDWNGDRDFGSGDLVFAFQDGGYEQGPRAGTAAVPEPSGWMILLLIGATSAALLRRQGISHG